MALKRRMITPDLFADPDLEPASKRVLFAGMLSMAEDSGCLEWKAGLLKALILPFDPATVADVQGWMDAMTDVGTAWTYQRASRTYAFLPDFPRWQGRLNRWGAPDSVPLPSGITFSPSDVKERLGSGTYEWPSSRQELDREELDPKNLNSKEAADLTGTALDLKDQARTKPASSALQADDAEAIRILTQKLGEERTNEALRKTRRYCQERGVGLNDKDLRFHLEAELESSTST